ncbi:MAG: hypothetical protein IIZ07_08195 [Ruminococcus sp.]|nr:hypothetical protein [Ruminococcus sp.]
MGEFLIHIDTGQELVLEHHGILGQKWGVRRFQNPDGSLTAEGRDRYDVGEPIKRNRDSRISGSTQSAQPKGSKRPKVVREDVDSLSEEEFVRKYGVSKETYRKKHRRGVIGLVAATAGIAAIGAVAIANVHTETTYGMNVFEAMFTGVASQSVEDFVGKDDRRTDRNTRKDVRSQKKKSKAKRHSES